MKGSLVDLYRAQLVEGPSGPRGNVPGTLGVFAYDGAGKPGDLCLFAPDDPADLGGRKKLRPSPGTAEQDGDLLRFTVKDNDKPYAWRIAGTLTDPAEIEDFLAFAEANDRIIRHLLEGARLA